jgi:hypothetical protein
VLQTEKGNDYKRFKEAFQISWVISGGKFQQYQSNVANLLHARMAHPQKQLFLGNTCMHQWNNGVTEPASMQRLGKHTSAQAQ